MWRGTCGMCRVGGSCMTRRHGRLGRSCCPLGLGGLSRRWVRRNRCRRGRQCRVRRRLAEVWLGRARQRAVLAGPHGGLGGLLPAGGWVWWLAGVTFGLAASLRGAGAGPPFRAGWGTEGAVAGGLAGDGRASAAWGWLGRRCGCAALFRGAGRCDPFFAEFGGGLAGQGRDAAADPGQGFLEGLGLHLGLRVLGSRLAAAAVLGNGCTGAAAVLADVLVAGA